MKLARILFIVIVSCTFSTPWGDLVASDIKSPATESIRQEEEDIVCGPRCIQFLMKHYKSETVDLLDIVKEIQWPDLSAGSTLESIESALRKRGIYTRALHIDPNYCLSWTEPVVVHLKATSELNFGHYVIWLPSSDENVQDIWSGPDGFQRLPTAQFTRISSGSILLTSKTVINSEKIRSYHRLWLEIRLAQIASLTIVLIIVLSWILRRRQLTSQEKRTTEHVILKIATNSGHIE